jgi:hypothetical protein
MARIRVQEVELKNGEAEFELGENFDGQFDEIFSVRLHSNRGLVMNIDAHGDESDELFDATYARIVTISRQTN